MSKGAWLLRLEIDLAIRVQSALLALKIANQCSKRKGTLRNIQLAYDQTDRKRSLGREPDPSPVVVLLLIILSSCCGEALDAYYWMALILFSVHCYKY